MSKSFSVGSLVVVHPKYREKRRHTDKFYVEIDYVGVNLYKNSKDVRKLSAKKCVGCLRNDQFGIIIGFDFVISKKSQRRDEFDMIVKMVTSKGEVGWVSINVLEDVSIGSDK